MLCALHVNNKLVIFLLDGLFNLVKLLFSASLSFGFVEGLDILCSEIQSLTFLVSPRKHTWYHAHDFA